MAPLRTYVRKEASDGASIAFHGVTSDQRPACGHSGIPDRHTTRAPEHGPRVQLQGGEQAGGRPTGQGAAAAAWQRWTPLPTRQGQQCAVFRPQERPIGHAASANSDRTGDAAGGGHVTPLAALLIEAALAEAPGLHGLPGPVLLLATDLYNVMFVATAGY